ncbi:Transcriptional regulator, TetR family [Frankia canadensis]|uniref:Transcriptional regulator, TetR family n=1 Tax=Frankia canadensis TaxID=1836972 RepID=A0A2I2KZW5_9ACTN|nr:TetR/AcrR family transcriptional regulator [Frankia canadensis]SNQ51206.1 Transcriptional regulator, TetR family [Frankia canadensis]SOU58496.1 Transcriptional regulator, TetR family [Frankia canadensis]
MNPPLARVAPRPVLPTPSPRVAEIITVSRELLEKEGAEALTMRRLAEVLGIRAPSLYKHISGKPQLEARLLEASLLEFGDALHTVLDRAAADRAATGGAASDRTAAAGGGTGDRSSGLGDGDGGTGTATVVDALLTAYRGYARAHPNLYRLFTAGPLARDQLAPGVEDWAGEPFYRATGDPYRAQALWAAAHGTVILELDGRYLPGSDLDRTWSALAAAFAAAFAG